MTSTDKTLSTEEAQAQTSADSKTVGVKTFSERRDRVTVRIEPKLKEDLKTWCLANGLSLCHVFEGLISAYLYGVNEKVNLDVKRPTINLTVERVVERHRRVLWRGPDGEVKSECFNATVGCWRLVSGERNRNGHGDGCQCTVCEPGRYVKLKLPQ